MFVIDGSSGLTDKNYTGYESDAQWFAQKLGTSLQTALYDTGRTIGDIISEITSDINAKYETLLSGTHVDEIALPTACVAVLRINGGNIEYFNLGDCVTVVLMKNGDMEILFDDTVPKLDNAVVSHVSEISRSKGIPFGEAMVYGKDMLVANRLKRNKTDGYWILDLSGAGIGHAFTRTYTLGDVSTVMIMSDGFAEIVQLYGLYDFETLIKKAETAAPDTICDELFEMQDRDQTMDKYPRLKHRDDSSAAWGRVAAR